MRPCSAQRDVLPTLERERLWHHMCYKCLQTRDVQLCTVWDSSAPHAREWGATSPQPPAARHCSAWHGQRREAVVSGLSAACVVCVRLANCTSSAATVRTNAGRLCSAAACAHADELPRPCPSNSYVKSPAGRNAQRMRRRDQPQRRQAMQTAGRCTRQGRPRRSPQLRAQAGQACSGARRPGLVGRQGAGRWRRRPAAPMRLRQRCRRLPYHLKGTGLTGMRPMGDEVHVVLGRRVGGAWHGRGRVATRGRCGEQHASVTSTQQACGVALKKKKRYPPGHWSRSCSAEQ
jgi:hypothetical protein